MSLDGPASVDLLNDHHDFPGTYMFKVIGKVDDGFIARVLTAVREELRLAEDPPFKLRQTPGGRHISITIEPEVQDGYEVLAVYERVREIEGLVVLC